ncbi:DNA polymerase III subunit chi [Brevundimonas sp. 2R-24]|uniref:DNA polymerase III subunit chi n=1 Tax=Peiella sedimenti TaxID=3061083 RepID=A0ABT8SL58_9CAUL|nr:DNA polymerase III subunit chi [Caulobacteraceae bacterium XZ-24]
MAGEVWFYHLERSVLDQALPDLLDKTLSKGWRALVRVRDPDRLEALDDALWSWRDDSFLAHGRDDQAHAERQPILMGGEGAVNLNGAQALFIVDGAEAGDADAFERCVILFDGRDPEQVEAERARWKRLKGQGLKVTYWRQEESGRWAQMA